MQIISGSNSIEFSKELSKKMNWELSIPNYKIFNDGESYLRLSKPPTEEIIIIQSLYYPQDTHLMQLYNLISTAKRLGSKNITVYTPYFSYARSDKEILQYEAISARTVLHILEMLGVNHLITLDIHNPQIFKFAKTMKITNIYPIKSVSNYFKTHLSNLKNILIVSPDQGAIQRAEMLANEMGLKFTSLEKTRHPITGNVQVTTKHTKVSSETVIIVDDIISTGTSLAQASSLLRIMGVSTIHYFITHFLSSEALDALKEISDGIIISTHSVPGIVNQISTIDDLCEVLSR
ncbi:MAG: Ribose-phosphate pyrophosphokinase [Candidatus Heimdallarchaeota archaeon LC_2]|nr:MAG: Ribose-phosphate pyrophosphokinase [Candidatus Heimdallarchaeota archaeon LC_2]